MLLARFSSLVCWSNQNWAVIILFRIYKEFVEIRLFLISQLSIKLTKNLKLLFKVFGAGKMQFYNKDEEEDNYSFTLLHHLMFWPFLQKKNIIHLFKSNLEALCGNVIKLWLLTVTGAVWATSGVGIFLTIPGEELKLSVPCLLQGIWPLKPNKQIFRPFALAPRVIKVSQPY